MRNSRLFSYFGWGLARGAADKMDGFADGGPEPPADRTGPILELFQRRVRGGYAPSKLPEAISVAFTPMALPAGARRRGGAGSARSHTVGTAGYIVG